MSTQGVVPPLGKAAPRKVSGYTHAMDPKIQPQRWLVGPEKYNKKF